MPGPGESSCRGQGRPAIPPATAHWAPTLCPCTAAVSLPAPHRSWGEPLWGISHALITSAGEPLRTSRPCSQLQFTGLNDLATVPEPQLCGSKPQALLGEIVHLSSSCLKDGSLLQQPPEPDPPGAAIAELPSLGNRLSQLHTLTRSRNGIIPMQIGWKSPVDGEVEKMNIAPRSRTGTSLGASDICLHKCPVTEVSICTGLFPGNQVPRYL